MAQQAFAALAVFACLLFFLPLVMSQASARGIENAIDVTGNCSLAFTLFPEGCQGGYLEWANFDIKNDSACYLLGRPEPQQPRLVGSFQVNCASRKAVVYSTSETCSGRPTQYIADNECKPFPMVWDGHMMIFSLRLHFWDV